MELSPSTIHDIECTIVGCGIGRNNHPAAEEATIGNRYQPRVNHFIKHNSSFILNRSCIDLLVYCPKAIIEAR